MVERGIRLTRPNSGDIAGNCLSRTDLAKLPLETLWMSFIVGIEKGDDITTRLRQTPIAGSGQAEIRCIAHVFGLRKTLQNPPNFRTLGGAIIYNDNLICGPSLALQGSQCPCQSRRVPIARNDH